MDDDLFDLDDEHVPMALAVMRAHPHLKDVRFKLVPGKTTEGKYWAALFGILHDGGINIKDLVGAIDDDYETGGEIDEIDPFYLVLLSTDQNQNGISIDRALTSAPQL